MTQPLASWSPPGRPTHTVIEGRAVRLEPTGLGHAPGLFAAFTSSGGATGWDYLPYGPFGSGAEFEAWLSAVCLAEEPLFFTVLNRATGAPEGLISYLRIRAEHGSVEIGHVHFSPLMARSVRATEATFLLMQHAFDDLRYRRVEWKCNAANARSRRAAERLGFTYEGLFRQDMVVKGKNRDTAWYSILDHEWSAVSKAITAWLAPENFDEGGAQKRPLEQFRGA